MRTKFLTLNKVLSSELVFLIIKLSSDDINDINFDLFGKLLKFIFTFVILSIMWVLLFSKTGHWRRKWVSSSTLVLHNLQIISFVFTPIYLPFSISRLWAIILNLVSTLLYKTDAVLIASIARCELNSNMCARRWINIWSIPTGNGF